jgi:cobalt-zinc-cadmium efflux system membrane fusion protein
VNKSISRHGWAAVIVPVVVALTGCGDDSAAVQDATSTETSDEHATEEVSRIVSLTPQQAMELGIEIGVLDAGGVNVLERPATVRLDPDRIALVGPRIEAKVERVLRDLGDAVRPNEPLAVMSSVALGEAKAQHLALKARLTTARAAYERERRLFGDRISSQAEVLEAEAQFRAAEADVDVIHERLRLYGLTQEQVEAIEPDATEPLSFFRLTSPVAGVVQRRDISPGQTVGPSDTPIHVARLDRLWVMIDAFEQDVPRLETGQRVTLSLRSIPDTTFEAVTDWISFELDPETRTIKARAVVQNAGGMLRAGMFGTVLIHVDGGAGYATIPVDAVQTIDGGKVVFVPGDEPGEFRAVPARIGAEGAGMVELTAGLAPGDSAVVSGAFELMSAATAGGRSAEHGH